MKEHDVNTQIYGLVERLNYRCNTHPNPYNKTFAEAIRPFVPDDKLGC